MSTNRGNDTGSRESPDLTFLLNQMRKGDPAASAQAVDLIYTHLRRIASSRLRHERPGHTLQTTALVHEAYVRLVGSEGLEIQNRSHFYAVASRQMRRILVDYSRAKHALRRGQGAISVDLEKVQIGSEPHHLDLLLVDEALTELDQLDPRAARVVELRYFGGHTDEEVMEVLGVSRATVRRDWEFARSWLFDRLTLQPKAARKKP